MEEGWDLQNSKLILTWKWGLVLEFEVFVVSDNDKLDEMIDVDCGQVDHTKTAELGPIRCTFSSIRGPSHSALQKRLHLWRPCCLKITWRCPRAWELWGEPSSSPFLFHLYPCLILWYFIFLTYKAFLN